MNIQLVQGNFSSKAALEITTQMIHGKIKLHKNKITNSDNDEDIKNRESKIKKLQKDLYDIRNIIENAERKIYIQ